MAGVTSPKSVEYGIIVAFLSRYEKTKDALMKIHGREDIRMKFRPHEKCPYGDVCGHRDDFIDLGAGKCEGINPERDCEFVCDLFLEDRPLSESISCFAFCDVELTN